MHIKLTDTLRQGMRLHTLKDFCRPRQYLQARAMKSLLATPSSKQPCKGALGSFLLHAMLQCRHGDVAQSRVE